MTMFSLRATNRAILPVLWRTPYQGIKDRSLTALVGVTRNSCSRIYIANPAGTNAIPSFWSA